MNMVIEFNKPCNKINMLIVIISNHQAKSVDGLAIDLCVSAGSVKNLLASARELLAVHGIYIFYNRKISEFYFSEPIKYIIHLTEDFERLS